MAQNSTVQLNIATTNTAKATKDVKSLKEQIKDLKNEMAGLTKGTDEYNEAAAQLGDLMHKQTEITQAAKLATNDYGQTLANITSISAGAVGSLSALNGVMNLIGASSDEATEAMRKIQSLMAIVQGLNQLDSAEKAFKGLWTRIKLLSAARKEDTQATVSNTTAQNANTTAGNLNAASMSLQTKAAKTLKLGLISLGNGFKTLGVAIKAFMMSNPFTMIILAITTIITLVSNLVSKARQAAEEAAKIRFENALADLQEMSRQLGDMGTEFSNELKVDIAEQQLKKLKDDVSKTSSELKALTEAYKEDIKTKQDELDRARLTYGETSDEAKEKLKELLRVQSGYYLTSMYYYDQYRQELRDKIKAAEEEQEKARGQRYRDLVTEIANNKKLLEQADKDYETAAISFTEHWRQITVNDVKEADRLRKEQEAAEAKRAADAKQAAEKRRAAELSAIKTAYEMQKIVTSAMYRDQELSDEEHYDRQIAELEAYIETWTKLRKKHNRELGKKGKKENGVYPYLTDEDLLEIARMNDQEVELERKKTEAIIELRKKLADSMNYRPESSKARVDESRYQNAQNAMTDETGARYLEQQEELYNAWWVRKYRLLQEYNKREVEEERAHNDELNRLAMERYEEEERVLTENRDGDAAYEEERFRVEMGYLDQKLNAKLISQLEYNQAVEEAEREHQERMWEIENEYADSWQEIQNNRTETLRDIAQQRYEIELEEMERRKELISTYISAYQSVNSAISGILAQAQQLYDEGSKKYEKIQETSIIMDTISGSLAAYMSGVKSGLPAPYNFILGGVLSLAALAEGKLALDNLHNKKLSAGASNAPSVSAYQTVAYETGADLQGEIRDQRVYVTETDISETVNRVNVIEAESTY